MTESECYMQLDRLQQVFQCSNMQLNAYGPFKGSSDTEARKAATAFYASFLNPTDVVFNSVEIVPTYPNECVGMSRRASSEVGLSAQIAEATCGCGDLLSAMLIGMTGYSANDDGCTNIANVMINAFGGKYTKMVCITKKLKGFPLKGTIANKFCSLLTETAAEYTLVPICNLVVKVARNELNIDLKELGQKLKNSQSTNLQKIDDKFTGLLERVCGRILCGKSTAKSCQMGSNMLLQLANSAINSYCASEEEANLPIVTVVAKYSVKGLRLRLPYAPGDVNTCVLNKVRTALANCVGVTPDRVSADKLATRDAEASSFALAGNQSKALRWLAAAAAAAAA
eukprot:CAMPEP_0113695004 /NCGR_PEP_ID=MMETSP0038_2-20120614/20631_1 /TAXON_ID=2898 /ORGANISM="Cryptomonas paramecium" /LENGTH=340 /DNA_ID=CAMNT_0000617443 /DNA_START=221 /DNA_END=1240 /DNA_ORIENTATION=+ /assembly_acc=CAM_ASM_000170